MSALLALQNPYNTLHGGAVAAVAEAVALACARAVAGDREFFLGESATSYLSAARVGVSALETLDLPLSLRPNHADHITRSDN